MFKQLFEHTFKNPYVGFGVAALILFSFFIQIDRAAPAFAQDLIVDISVSPSVGNAPLNNVDLSAVVTGTATGDITYKFDCTNDGSWDKTITTSNASFTAVDLCNYQNPGNYSAIIDVTRGGLVFNGAAAILVRQGQVPNLIVDISANPSSGNAPLNNVDLSAVVTGTATGDITYKFDCTNDGSWDKTITTSNASFTAVDLCNYQNPGNYSAIIDVTRGGLVFNGAAAILVRTVEAAKTLSVSLSANPDSGTAPLNDVDLTAVVSGTAQGMITYKFDCTSNGDFEQMVTVSNTTYTATDLCDYASVGSFIPKVIVERAGLTAQDTDTVSVRSGDVSFSVEKKARNITKNQDIFGDSIAAAPGDAIEFEIRILGAGNIEAKNVNVRDTLPAKLVFNGNLKVDGASSSQDILQGFSIGNLATNQVKIITFQAKVAAADKFSFGTTDVVNAAVVFNSDLSSTDAATVKVERKGVLGGATEVPTGMLNPLTISIILSVLAAFILSYFFLLRYYAAHYLFPNMTKSKTERQLTMAIDKIKKKERNI